MVYCVSSDRYKHFECVRFQVYDVMRYGIVLTCLQPVWPSDILLFCYLWAIAAALYLPSSKTILPLVKVKLQKYDTRSPYGNSAWILTTLSFFGNWAVFGPHTEDCTSEDPQCRVKKDIMRQSHAYIKSAASFPLLCLYCTCWSEQKASVIEKKR